MKTTKLVVRIVYNQRQGCYEYATHAPADIVDMSKLGWRLGGRTVDEIKDLVCAKYKETDITFIVS